MNILIVKLSAIGDVLHTLPALSALRSHYPDAHITWLIEEDAAALVKGHMALDRVLISKRKRWLKGLLGPKRLESAKGIYYFLKELRDTRYDLIIDFQGLLKSSLLIALSRGERKVGFGKGMEHMEGSYLFVKERIPPVDMDNHALLRGLMLLEAIGVPSTTIEYHLPVRDEDRETVARLLRENGVENEDRLVAINPVAKWQTKLWQHSKFAELADRLLGEYGARVVFTGGREDRSTIRDIVSLMQGTPLNLAGHTSLTGLAALYEQTAVVISTDTGPMHLAAAVGAPVVALFGPTAPWRTGPFGPGHRIVRVGTECSPCFKRQCDDVKCMEGINVAQVLEAVEELSPPRHIRR